MALSQLEVDRNSGPSFGITADQYRAGVRANQITTGSSSPSINTNVSNAQDVYEAATTSDTQLASAIRQVLNASRENSALSQEMADKQMDFQREANNIAMAFSAEQAQMNRDFQERMSNTSYQRAVQDLQQAGLNPVLAALNSGASTPSGNAGTGVTSAGAKGEVDTFGTSGITSLLGNALNNAVSLQIAGMNRANVLDEVAGQIQSSNINAGAQYYSSDQATKRTEMELRQSDINSARSYAASTYGSNKSYAGTVYSSDTSRENSKDTNRTNLIMNENTNTTNYDNTINSNYRSLFGTLSNLMNGLGSAVSGSSVLMKNKMLGIKQ